ASENIQGVQIAAGFNLNTDNEGYKALKSWLGTKYAIMDVSIADDFSNVPAVTAQVQDAMRNLSKDTQYAELVLLGLKVSPKDKDATAENGKKLATIARLDYVSVLFGPKLTQQAFGNGNLHMVGVTRRGPS
ncbi:hypothetical protein MTO96_040238, partial [Rhipicephalus appendiculatus]